MSLAAASWRRSLTTPYVCAVGVTGAAVLAVSLPTLPLERWPEVLLFAALCAAAQLMPVQLFRSSSVSVSFAMSFAALVYLGPAAAVVVNLAAGAVVCFTPRRKPLIKMIFNLGLFTIQAAVAGWLYTLAGGVIGPGRFELSLVLPALLGATSFFLVGTTLTSTVISLTSNASFIAVWTTNYRWLAPNCIALSLLGFTMGIATQTIGVPGLTIFLLPLGMAWYSFKLYMAKTEEVRRRNEELQLTNAQLDVANARLQQRVTELDSLNRIGLTLNGSLDLGNVLGEIGEAAMRLVPSAQAVGVALADAQTGRLDVVSSIALPAGAGKALVVSNGPAARAVETDALAALADTGETMPDLAALGVRAVAAMPLHLNGSGQGAFLVTFAAMHDTGEDERRILSTLAEQASTAIRNARLYAEIEQSYLNTIQAMVQVVDSRERYAQGHSERVRAYAAQTAKAIGLEEKQVATLELAALFHDLGHIGIPETVLNKPGELSKDEWELVRKHPLLGVTILKQVPRMEAVVPVILQHHERYDGQGYPAGLLGDDTHVLAQILAVADAFEALTSHRPYRAALTREQAVGELRKNAGTQFSPRIVEEFVKATETEVRVVPGTQAAFLKLLQA